MSNSSNRKETKQALEEMGVEYQRNLSTPRLEELLAAALSGEKIEDKEDSKDDGDKEGSTDKEVKEDKETEKVGKIKDVEEKVIEKKEDDMAFTMVRNVKHDGVLYKKDKSYKKGTLSSLTLEVFADKGHIK